MPLLFPAIDEIVRVEEMETSPSPSPSPSEEAQHLLRSRICDPLSFFSLLCPSSDSNHSKLKFLISSSVTEAVNNSVLLLGPRGCGKNAVLELVLKELLAEYPDLISVIRLNGLLHSDDGCALKEISRQLCVEHQLSFTKMASFDDNTQFLIDMLRECGLAHKTIVFVLDEFDLFAQGKQRLLYSLLDAMQSVTSQAVVIGISCRLDADQLLEKRVRSRLSQRKLLFCPPSKDELERLLECVLSLPINSSLPQSYVVDFNKRIRVSFLSCDALFGLWLDIKHSFPFIISYSVCSLLLHWSHMCLFHSGGERRRREKKMREKQIERKCGSNIQNRNSLDNESKKKGSCN